MNHANIQCPDSEALRRHRKAPKEPLQAMYYGVALTLLKWLQGTAKQTEWTDSHGRQIPQTPAFTFLAFQGRNSILRHDTQKAPQKRRNEVFRAPSLCKALTLNCRKPKAGSHRKEPAWCLWSLGGFWPLCTLRGGCACVCLCVCVKRGVCFVGFNLC